MKRYLFFDAIEEHRGSYLAQYEPPIGDHRFATLHLTFLTPASWGQVSELVGKEIQYWIKRYRVPLMTWVCDDKGDPISPNNQEADCLGAWHNSGRVVQSWNLDELNAALKEVSTPADWREIYTDIPVRTGAEVKAAADEKWSEHLKHVRLLKIGLVLWLAAIPAGYAIFEFLGPAWLGLVGLILVLWNALKTALKIWGYTKPSAEGEKEAEKRRKMHHYFYHCEQNPDGFRQLMIENLENDARKQIREKAQELSRDRSDGHGSSRQPI